MRHSIDNGDAARSAELHRAQYLAGTGFLVPQDICKQACEQVKCCIVCTSWRHVGFSWSRAWHAMHGRRSKSKSAQLTAYMQVTKWNAL